MKNMKRIIIVVLLVSISRFSHSAAGDTISLGDDLFRLRPSSALMVGGDLTPLLTYKDIGLSDQEWRNLYISTVVASVLLRPDTDNGADIGTSALRFGNIYVSTLNATATTLPAGSTNYIWNTSTLQSNSIFHVSSGSANGTITSTTGFVGPGSSLTALNASNISAGILNSLRLDVASVTMVGPTIDLATEVIGTLSGSNISGGTFGAVNGSALTNLNATNINAGTLNALRLDVASVTMVGPVVDLNTSEVSGTLPSANLDTSSITKQGNIFNAANKLLQLDGSAYVPNGNIDPSTYIIQTSSPTLTGKWTFSGSSHTLLNQTSNVGIGTTSPDSKLKVMGDVRFDLDGNTGLSFFDFDSSNARLRMWNNTRTQKVQITTSGDSYFTGGNVGIGTAVPDAAFVVISTGATTGRYTPLGWTHSSDIKFKKNIKSMENPLAKIQKVRGTKFDLKTDKGNKSERIGFVAQELEKEFPEVVYTSPEDGSKSIAYGMLEPVLLEAVKALKNENDELRERVAVLEKK